MIKNSIQQVRDVELFSEPIPFGEKPVPTITVVLPPNRNEGRRAFLAGAAIALTFASSLALGWMFWDAEQRKDGLANQLSSVEALRVQEQQAARGTVLELEQRIAEQNKLIALLEAERLELAATTTASPMKGPLSPRRAAGKPDSAPLDSSAPEPLNLNSEELQPSVESQPEAHVAEPPSPLDKAVEATSKLAATNISEPPTLETIKAHIKAGDPEVASNRDAVKQEKSPVMKLLTNRIFIDSAVLGGSLLVPPSLPLTLAQSRLGRGLTNRVMKRTDLDKTVAGKVAQDVGNMPITQKKKKK